MADAQTSPGPRARRIAALAALAVSAYVALASRSYVFHDSTGPGPGFFPLWIGSLGVLVALALLVPAPSRLHSQQESWKAGLPGSGTRIAVIVAAMVVAAIMIEPLGFRLTVFLLLTVLFRVYAMAGWIRPLIAALVGSIVVFFIFHHLLKVLLPIGALGI